MTALPHVVTIWKFPLEVLDAQQVEMPEGAKILHVGAQDHRMWIWAQVWPGNLLTPRWFRIIGTGHPIEDGVGDHVGSVVLGSFVWHVFEVAQ
jgi:hypothetical protein